MPPQKSARPAITLFYSFSHKDEKLRDALASHLALLRREGVIKEWYDRKIDAGEEWADEIDGHLESASLILLLVSSDFIASDYCWGKEMQRALARHEEGTARVIPVILRPCDWSGAPFGKLQGLPKNVKAVTLWSNRDAAWLDVAKGIRTVVEERAAGLPAAREVSMPAAPAKPQPAAVPLNPHRLAERPGGQPLRMIYSAKNGESLPGTLVRREGDAPTGDVAVDEAYDALGAAYYFFWDIFGRHSIDGKGMPVEATVHYGQRYDNAFWSGKQIILGDGDGELFNRFTISVDVIANELSKGIIQSEVELVYYEQTGALLSSLSDVFGSLVKQYSLQQTAAQADWLIGDKLFAVKIKGKGLRSLAKPGTAYDDSILGKDPQSEHMRGYVRTVEDNGGIHLNSGIPNHAFYLIATQFGGYAWEKAGRIWYETLCDKRLKPKAQFLDFARLTFATAQRLYGAQSGESKLVKRGWDMVGIKFAAK